jgi:hypothetical protein
MSLEDGVPGALAGLPEWWPEAVLWLGVALLGAAAGAALAAWTLVRRLADLRGELRALETLPELQRTLARWLAERDDLDLRRIEHLLIDLRDGSKRVEELLLRAEELRAARSDALVPAAAPSLAERIVNRLVALGYERIELVTPQEALETFARGGGDVLVEARREGVLCKGRVRVRGGRIDSVHLQPAFPIFP